MEYAKFDQDRANRLIRIIRDDLGQKQSHMRQNLQNELSSKNIQNRSKLKKLYESQVKEIALTYLDAYLKSIEKDKQVSDKTVSNINQYLKSYIKNQCSAFSHNLQDELTRIGAPNATKEAEIIAMSLIENRTISYIHDVLNERIQIMNESLDQNMLEEKKELKKVDNWTRIKNDFDESKLSVGKKINFIEDEFIRKIIFRDIEHAYILCKTGFYKPSVLIAGGVIEEILRQFLLFNGKKPKRDSFDEYIKTCEEFGLLKSAIRQLSDSVRQFRNLVHIVKEKSPKYSISKATAWGAVSIIFTICNDF
jgi:hypothetical protein